MTTKPVPQAPNRRHTEGGRPECSRPVRRADLSDRPVRRFRPDRTGVHQHAQHLQRAHAQVSIYGMLAIGMTFVILTGGIDLSIGSVLALAGLVAAAVEKGSRGLLGAGAGEAHGYGLRRRSPRPSLSALRRAPCRGRAVSRLKVPPFIVTLGGMSVFRGLALVFSSGPADQRLSARLQVLGPGDDRPGAGAGHPLPGLSRSSRISCCVTPIRPAHLRGRRQPGGGAAIGPERRQR